MMQTKRRFGGKSKTATSNGSGTGARGRAIKTASTAVKGTSSAQFYLLRFRCFDPARTIQFYTECLDMRVAKDFTAKDRYRYIYIEHSWGGLPKLRFERDKLVPITRGEEKTPRGGDDTLLVLYVRHIRDVCARIRASDTGGWVYVEPTSQVSGLAALVIDPNGFMLHLVQMSSDTFLKEDSVASPRGSLSTQASLRGPRRSMSKIKKEVHTKVGLPPASWGVRMAFACINVQSASEVAEWYERIFSTLGHTGGSSEDAVQSSSRKFGQSEQLDGVHSSRKGLHIVDTEELSLSLAKFVWVAPGPRSLYTAICFLHRVKRKGAPITRAVRNSDAHEAVAVILQQKRTTFLGFAIIVDDLALAVEEMKTHPLSPVHSFNEEGEMHIGGAGTFVEFTDINNAITQLYDISSLHSDPLKSKKNVKPNVLSNSPSMKRIPSGAKILTKPAARKPGSRQGSRSSTETASGSVYPPRLARTKSSRRSPRNKKH